MISYRQADLVDKIRNQKSDTFKLTFMYDEAEMSGVSRFFYNSISHVEGNTDRETEDKKWHYIHDAIPRIVEEERVAFPDMTVQEAFIMVRFIVNRLKDLKGVISAEKTNQEIERDKYDSNGDPTGEPLAMKYTVTVVL